MSHDALILIDFINEIVAPTGKMAAKGYPDFAARHGTFERVQALLAAERHVGTNVIHIGLGFSPDYKEMPHDSPLFSQAQKYGAFTLGGPGAAFYADTQPMANEAVLVKHRVSGFYGTALEVLLRTKNVKNVTIVGCATDMAVQTTAREAHDRGYVVTIIGDCCVAGNDRDHDDTLRLMQKVARVVNLDEFLNGKKGK